MQEWQNVEQDIYTLLKNLTRLCRVGQHARINNTSKTILRWVNMQEWWVNMNRNGGSTWSGIYNFYRTRLAIYLAAESRRPA